MDSRDRALAVSSAFLDKQKGYEVKRGSQGLVFDELPTAVLNKAWEIVGISVMVRLFEGATEVRIDPDRIIVNAPLVPRASLTYEEGELDSAGRFTGSGRIVAHARRRAAKGVAYRRIGGAQDPLAAIVEAVWDSIDLTPNAKGWRPR